MDPDIKDRLENIIATLLARGEVTVTLNFENKIETYYIHHNNGFVYDR